VPDWEPSELDVSAREVVNGEALAELDGRKPAEPVKTSPELASPEETLEPDCAALPVSEAAEAAEGVETEVPRVVGAGVCRPDDGAVDNAADPVEGHRTGLKSQRALKNQMGVQKQRRMESQWVESKWMESQWMESQWLEKQTVEGPMVLTQCQTCQTQLVTKQQNQKHSHQMGSRSLKRL